MLYALNLYSEVCQLFLNNTGKNIIQLIRLHDRVIVFKVIHVVAWISTSFLSIAK